MTTPKSRDLPPIPFHPVDGVETREAAYVEWLLAGGKPLPEFDARSWAQTVPGGLA